MMMHPDEIEEMEYRFGPKLWDAGEGVCCAAFQLGACAHTEGDDDLAWYDEDGLSDAELAELRESDRQNAIVRLLANITAPDTCPF